MFARLMSLIETRRSTKFLLDRSDDRLLADIGLTRGEIADYVRDWSNNKNDAA